MVCIRSSKVAAQPAWAAYLIAALGVTFGLVSCFLSDDDDEKDAVAAISNGSNHAEVTSHWSTSCVTTEIAGLEFDMELTADGHGMLRTSYYVTGDRYEPFTWTKVSNSSLIVAGSDGGPVPMSGTTIVFSGLEGITLTGSGLSFTAVMLQGGGRQSCVFNLTSGAVGLPVANSGKQD